MVDYMENLTRIGRLHLRAPAANAAAGERMAIALAHALADELPPVVGRHHVGALHVRVPTAPGTSEGEMTASNAAVIEKALGRLSG